VVPGSPSPARVFLGTPKLLGYETLEAFLAQPEIVLVHGAWADGSAMVSHPEETHERIVTAANAAAVPG
jgi:hypothetical protein